MNFEEYERREWALYSAFAEAVAAILTAAIERDPAYRLQQVKSRAKDPTSLKDKLADRGLSDTQTLSEDIKDLAGCRIVFYTNADVARFTRSGILRDNFEFVDVKIHHPRLGSDKAAEQFRSDNITVRLKPERATLPEYARFADLCCEIQIQTILNHSWSEMAHDTIYKQPKLKGGFGAKAMASIERRLDKVMREHLVPAGHDFQKIAHDFERLMAGKDLFDQEPLRLIREAPDNNERHDAIERFAEDVLRFYDDVATEYAEIVAALVDAVEASRKTDDVVISTPVGDYPGKSYLDVVRLVIGILQEHRYVGFDTTAEATIRLYAGAISDDERTALIAVGEELAKNHLGVWKQYGPIAQQALLDVIEALPEETREQCRPLLRTMYDKILSPEVEGTEWASPDTLTISSGAVAASPQLGEIRGRAIAQLKTMLETATADSERQALIDALFQASDTPFRSGYDNALALLVLENAKTVVAICRELASDWSLEILQKLEDRMLRLHYAHRNVPAWLSDDPALSKANEDLLTEILAFRDEVNADPQFVTYKTLVGYDSVFPSAWEGDPFDFEARDAWRAEQTELMVASATDANADAWFATITRCAQTRSNDMATFPAFSDFLVKLATAKPDVVIGYLDRLDDRLAQFMPGMMRGLLEAGRDEVVDAKLREWIAQGQHLEHIAFFLKNNTGPDLELIVLTAARATAEGDDWAVTLSIGAAASRYAHAADDQLKEVFLSGLRYLTERGDVRWMTAHLLRWGKSPLILALRGTELDALFAALLILPRLEYNVEELLAAIASQDVDAVIRFLGDRMAREREMDVGERYRAVPFTAHLLPAALKPHASKMVVAARAWALADGALFQFRGGHFVAQVFGDMPEDFEAELRAFVAAGDRQDIKLVLALLQDFEGNASVHALCRDIVEALPEDDKLLSNVEIALRSTGVVTGELGFAEAYEQRKALMEPWLEDTRPKVQTFARAFIHQIEQSIAGEQRRAEEDREFRQRQFEGGESE